LANEIKPPAVVIPDLPVPSASELSPDSPAAFEQASIALGVDIENQKAQNDLNKLLRSDDLEFHIHRVLKVFLWTVCLITLGGIITFSYHTLTPVKLHFLEPDQVEDIKSILFSGGMGAAISFIAQRYMSK
jgi:hypothetical protein